MLLIFREDYDVFFVVLMIVLIALSFIHWISIKRSEYVQIHFKPKLIAENQMKLSLHLKLFLSFGVLLFVDYHVQMFIDLRFVTTTTVKSLRAV